jgi:hypothetical protein
VNWNTPRTYSEVDAFAQACGAIPPNPRAYGWKGDNYSRGLPWTDGNLGITLYNHVLTPNKPSCYNGSGVPEGASTAASFHRGGVSATYADGHTDFIAETIDRRVWRDLASRSE